MRRVPGAGWPLSLLLLAGCSAVLGINQDYSDTSSPATAGAAGAALAAGAAGQAGVAGLSDAGGGGAGGASGVSGGGAGGTAGGGAGGASGAGMGGVGAGGKPGVRPPGPPTQDSTDTIQSTRAFAIKKFHFGQNDPLTDSAKVDAWRTIGFDIDGVNTTKDLALSEKPGTCLRDPLAKQSTLLDGDDGRDNSFGANLFAIFNQFGNGAVETDLNKGIANGSSPTLILLLSNLNEGPDDTTVSSSILLSLVEHPVKPPLWDGTDSFPVDSQSVINHAISQPKLTLVGGYLKNNTYVSGPFNDTSQPHVLFFPLGNIGFVGLTFLSLTVVVELDEAHEQAKKATLSGVVRPQDLEELFQRLLVSQFGCEGAKNFAGLAKQFYQQCDLRSDAPDFLDPTSTMPCDLVSFSFEMELERAQFPTQVIDGPPNSSTCDGAGGGAGGP
jgi:hypothetical protein